MTAATATAPEVIAAPGTPRCGDRYEGQTGIRCERPKDHDGGHLSETHDKYWQAAS